MNLCWLEQILSYLSGQILCGTAESFAKIIIICSDRNLRIRRNCFDHGECFWETHSAYRCPEKVVNVEHLNFLIKLQAYLAFHFRHHQTLLMAFQ